MLVGPVSACRGHGSLEWAMRVLAVPESTYRGRESACRGSESPFRGRESACRGRLSASRGCESVCRGRESACKGCESA